MGRVRALEVREQLGADRAAIDGAAVIDQLIAVPQRVDAGLFGRALQHGARELVALARLGRAAQPAQRRRLVVEGTHLHALLARAHLDVLVRGVELARVAHQRNLALVGHQVLDVAREPVLLGLEHRARGADRHQDARAAVLAAGGVHRDQELAHLPEQSFEHCLQRPHTFVDLSFDLSKIGDDVQRCSMHYFLLHRALVPIGRHQLARHRAGSIAESSGCGAL